MHDSREHIHANHRENEKHQQDQRAHICYRRENYNQTVNQNFQVFVCPNQSKHAHNSYSLNDCEDGNNLAIASACLNNLKDDRNVSNEDYEEIKTVPVIYEVVFF